ncbi:PucR family transcriptional regulator [Nocardioides alcanivorans]|uniref:PucR family transcriptional regulator n=1 Tax=Nocardioides alcanivorans TaxID=2897352 RepID=UPI001F1BAE08|nr:helix-turn-helix domain-containing protein [Nocardioides alcanivorans]
MRPGESVATLGSVPVGSLVVFTREQLALDSPTADLAVRFAVAAAAAGIVAETPVHDVALSTIRLADRHQLPIITVDRIDQSAVVHALDADVRAPEVVGSSLVAGVLERLERRGGDAPTVLGALREVLSTHVGLLDGSGRVIEGDDLFVDLRVSEESLSVVPEALLRALSASHPAAQSIDLSTNGFLVLHPVVVPPRTRAELWFGIYVPTSAGLLRNTVRQALSIGVWAFTAHLATRSLATERESRHRAMLLSEILEHPDSISRRTAERAVLLGWPLFGWHSVVHISLANGDPADASPGLGRDLEAALLEVGVDASLVDRPDGWVCWLTSEVAPEAADTKALAGKVRQALLAIESEHEGTRLCAGIGAPAQGPDGLAKSLREARRSGLLAASRETMAAVERTDRVGLSRVLFAWYSYRPARDLAMSVLQPLREADPSGQLVRTLGCYLDYESSATDTAAVLGVHRNTIVQRLSRIRSILGIDLTDPIDRLAAHLATRAEQLTDQDGSA